DQAETRPGGEAQEQPARGTGRTLSRRTMLRQSGAGAAGAIVAGALGAGTGGHAAMARAPAPRHRATSGTDPQPQDAIVGLLGAQPVANADLAQIWRFTIGGGVDWDAPVYEQFFRAVRAVNWMRPPSRRLRVLLGDPPFDYRRVRGVADKGYVLAMMEQRDAH